MKDPYVVLGVSKDASDEEIKDAYRALVKKYHPDKFADSDLAELANEKMKEINAAYDEIQNMRNGGSSKNNNTSSGFNPNSSSDNEFYTRVRQYINMGSIFEAESMLTSMTVDKRDAEWNYLYACVMVKKGYYADASRYFDIACNMAPSNNEYRHARDMFRSRSYNNGTYRSYQSRGCCDMDCCTSLICADCCCECMGGDLIRCC